MALAVEVCCGGSILFVDEGACRGAMVVHGPGGTEVMFTKSERRVFERERSAEFAIYADFCTRLFCRRPTQIDAIF